VSGELSRQLKELRRAVARRRRLLAAGLAAAAIACALTVLQPPAAATVRVVVAARDLPAGTTVRAADLRVARFAPGTAPDGSLARTDDAVGLVLAAGVRAGEPFTDLRFVGRPRLQDLASDGLVATPVRIADAGAARLVRTGDLVDVLAATPPTAGTAAGSATTVAEGVRVLVVPRADDAAGEGALLLLATDRPTASRLALAGVTSRLSITLRG
jgi:Flp pilus assembly protein CpaB